MDDENAAGAKFSDEFTISLIQHKVPDKNTKINARDNAPAMLAELIRVFVAEAATRAANQAHQDDASVCEVDHVEKILPQLLLDF